jgi:hypothetical protein
MVMGLIKPPMMGLPRRSRKPNPGHPDAPVRHDMLPMKAKKPIPLPLNVF